MDLPNHTIDTPVPVSPADRSPVLATKLNAPRLRASLVPRSGLLDQISLADATVTLVCAPAGYGKSTLIAHWLAESDRLAAWVSLDSYDSDPWNFYSLIATAIQTIDHSAVVETRQLLDSKVTPSSQAFALALLKDLGSITRPFVLVLDDYHVITDASIHSSVATLLANLPPIVHLILITRTESTIPLARLRGRQELLEIGAEDLRFSDDEAVELFQAASEMFISRSDVDALNEQAEGWVAGLQLVAHLLRGQPNERVHAFTREFSGKVRSIENYLWEEVIDRLPPEVVDFLVHTSILDQFCSSLCDEVTGRSDSARMLRVLERERLFVVSLDDFGEWYRYHHLFADVLRERLAAQSTEDQVLNLHKRAATWFAQNGQIEDASRHAIVGRDWDLAIPMLETLALQLFEQDRNKALYERLRVLPESVLRKSPLLAFHYGFAMSRVGKYEESMIPTRIAEEAWLITGDQAGIGRVRITQALRSIFTQDARRGVFLAEESTQLLGDDEPALRSLAFITLGGTHLYNGDTTPAEQALASARVLQDRTQIEWLQYTEMVFSSGVLTQQGRLAEAETLLRQVGSLTDHTQAIQYQHALNRMGSIQYETNDLEGSDRTFRHADTLSDETEIATWKGRFCLGLACNAWVRTDEARAYAEIDRAIAFAQKYHWTSILHEARALQARYWLASGQVALANRWATACSLDPLLPPVYDRQFEHLTYVRLCITDGRTAIAIKLLDNIASSVMAGGRLGEMVEVEVLRAIALKQQGNAAEALEAAERALSIAQQSGHVRTFLDEGELILPLLRHAAVRGTHKDYARIVLEQSEGQPRRSNTAQSDTVDALSEREIEVMRLVAAGLPNRDIGERLFISEKTVKKHLSRILSKLGASNRTQAADQARKLNLI